MFARSGWRKVGETGVHSIAVACAVWLQVGRFCSTSTIVMYVLSRAGRWIITRTAGGVVVVSTAKVRLDTATGESWQYATHWQCNARLFFYSKETKGILVSYSYVCLVCVHILVIFFRSLDTK